VNKLIHNATLVLIAALLSFSLMGCGTNQGQGAVKLASSHAIFKKYKNVDELEQNATLVVRAKFTGNRKVHHWYEDGDIADTASKSEIRLNKVLKGDYKTGDILNIYEPGYFAKGDVYASIEGYNLMNEEGEYLLYLKPIKDDDAYMIVGMFQGKFDMNKKEKAKEHTGKITIKELKEMEYFGEYADHFNDLKEQVHEKHNN